MRDYESEIQEKLLSYRRSKRLARMLGSWVLSAVILLLSFLAVLYAVEKLADLLAGF